MNKLSFILVMALACTSVAQQRQHGRERWRNDDPRLVSRVQVLSERVNSELQLNANQLNDRELLAVIDHLRGIKDILRLGDQPDPRPPRPGRVSVRGTIENTSYSLTGGTLEELNDQCVIAAEDALRRGSVDDIEVSVDFGAVRRLHNTGSYWRSKGEICNQILAATKQQVDLPVSHSSRYIVSGSVENISFLLKGYDRVDINQQCEDFYHAKVRGTSVDDIEASVNFEAPRKMHNNGSYWRTSFDVCQQIVRLL